MSDGLGVGTRFRWISLGIGLAAFLSVGTLLLQHTTWAISWTAAAVVLIAWWWITTPIPLWVTALLPLLIFPAVGAASLQATALQYFDPINLLFLGGMWIAKAMEEWGLHRRVALNVVHHLGAEPRGIVLGFMWVTAGVSMFISNTAAAVLMAPIGIAVIKRLKEHLGADERVKLLGAALMMGIGYAASIGGIGTKIGTGTNLVLVKQVERSMQLEIGFFTWLQIGLPIMLLCIPLTWWYLTRVATRLGRGELPGARAAISEARAEQASASRGEVVAAIAFTSAGILWMTRADIDLGLGTIPGWASAMPWTWSDVFGRPVSELPEPLAGLFGSRGTEAVVALGVSLPLFFIPVAPGRRALSVKEGSRVSWDLLVTLGGGFAMANAITSSGLSDLIASAFGSTSHLPPLLGLLLVCWTTTALSEVASNTATASILLPILAVTAGHLGVDPLTAMFAATLAASFGFMLPAGTPPNAVVFASGYVPARKMATAGLIVDVLGSAVIAVACYWLVPAAMRLP
jgi:solute carrier family 13 (sodium-dependent dicarboxylate transporter), member 2/3/5